MPLSYLPQNQPMVVVTSVGEVWNASVASAAHGLLPRGVGFALVHAKGSVLTHLRDRCASTCPLLRQQNSVSTSGSLEKRLFVLRSYSRALWEKWQQVPKNLSCLMELNKTVVLYLAWSCSTLRRLLFSNKVHFKIKSLFCEAQFCVFTVCVWQVFKSFSPGAIFTADPSLSLGITWYGCLDVQQAQLDPRLGDALCKLKTNSCVCKPDKRLS